MVNYKSDYQKFQGSITFVELVTKDLSCKKDSINSNESKSNRFFSLKSCLETNISLT